MTRPKARTASPSERENKLRTAKIVSLEPLRESTQWYVAQPNAETAWQTFSSNLALCIADLMEDDYLLISTKDDKYYIQFWDQGSFGIFVQATSNSFLNSEDRLSEGDCAKLVQLGWNPPTMTPGQPIPNGQEVNGAPDYFLDIANPIPYGKLAALAVETFRNVFGVAHPGKLYYMASGNEEPIRFPSLGIAREPGMHSTDESVVSEQSKHLTPEDIEQLLLDYETQLKRMTAGTRDRRAHCANAERTEAIAEIRRRLRAMVES